MMAVHCPDRARSADDVVGCGATFDADPDFEGLIDCPNCGIWFRADGSAE